MEQTKNTANSFRQYLLVIKAPRPLRVAFGATAGVNALDALANPLHGHT
jgi:hypothetical protein